MENNNIELLSLLLVVLVFLLDKIQQELSKFIVKDTPSKDESYEYKKYHFKKISIIVKMLASILFEIAIIIVYWNIIIDTVLNYQISFIHPEVNRSLSILLYAALIGLCIYSINLFIQILHK